LNVTNEHNRKLLLQKFAGAVFHPCFRINLPGFNSLSDKCHCEAVFAEAISHLMVFAVEKGIATPPEERRRLAMTSFRRFCPVEKVLTGENSMSTGIKIAVL
jgi:hypothetical protein